jgi:RpiR family carbohydrate utilization transcriptional regulator
MPPGVSLIDHMREVLPDLNKADQRVAEVILANIDAAIGMTTKELAGRAAVSEPTIVRFARRMGSAGFTDFKMRLSRDFATGRMFVMSDPPNLAQDSATISAQVYEATAQALAYSFAQRDPDALERAAAAIDKARRLFCFGTGGSSANVALEAENRFYRFEVGAVAIIDAYRQPVAASLCVANDAILAFSVTGRPHSLVASAKLARDQGATVISVTRPGSPLAKASSIVIGLVIPDDDRRFEIPNRSRYGQLYVLDCLATLLAARRAAAVGPKLHRAREVLQSWHGHTKQQPIGD